MVEDSSPEKIARSMIQHIFATVLLIRKVNGTHGCLVILPFVRQVPSACVLLVEQWEHEQKRYRSVT